MMLSARLAELTAVGRDLSDTNSGKAIEMISEIMAQMHRELLLKIEQEVDLAVCCSMRRRALQEKIAGSISPQHHPVISQFSRPVSSAKAQPIEMPKPAPVVIPPHKPVDIAKLALKEAPNLDLPLDVWDADMQRAAAHLKSVMQADDNRIAVVGTSPVSLPVPPHTIDRCKGEGTHGGNSAPWSQLVPLAPTVDILPPYVEDENNEEDDEAAEMSKCQASVPLWMQFGFASIVQAHEGRTITVTS